MVKIFYSHTPSFFPSLARSASILSCGMILDRKEKLDPHPQRSWTFSLLKIHLSLFSPGTRVIRALFNRSDDSEAWNTVIPDSWTNDSSPDTSKLVSTETLVPEHPPETNRIHTRLMDLDSQSARVDGSKVMCMIGIVWNSKMKKYIEKDERIKAKSPNNRFFLAFFREKSSISVPNNSHFNFFSYKPIWSGYPLRLFL